MFRSADLSGQLIGFFFYFYIVHDIMWFAGSSLANTEIGESFMIYICEYDDSAPAELLQQYAEHLPIPVYQGLAEGVKWKKYRERILAWLLFVYVVGYEKMKTLNIQRTALGKPYSAADAEFHFNISHCESACACIISDVPCGVDI